MENVALNESRTLRNNLMMEKFQKVRDVSEWQCEPLLIEDYGLQAMDEISPAKWHLAHTTWFFENFVLKHYLKSYKPLNKKYQYLFNSYYNGIGSQYPRAQRGLISRPSVEEVYAYRHHVNEAMCELMSIDKLCTDALIKIINLGCHHEQQHQELFFTDLKYCWFQNPLYPVYSHKEKSNTNKLITTNSNSIDGKQENKNWLEIHSGLYYIGFHDNPSLSLLDNFSFDNELPYHQHYLNDVSLSRFLVTNEEYLLFMSDNVYNRSEFWLSDAWQSLKNSSVKKAPLYWVEVDGEWFEYSLHGLQPLNSAAPVSHLSFYEADAYARWKKCRLPTEFEWEVFAKNVALGDSTVTRSLDKEVYGQFLESEQFQPTVEVGTNPAPIGKLWQWTSSAYLPYPGFKTTNDAVGEYNGKFMCNQMVLRGGSCVTSRSHYRNTYRNFFYPADQWQFTGLRLAK